MNNKEQLPIPVIFLAAAAKLRIKGREESPKVRGRRDFLFSMRVARTSRLLIELEFGEILLAGPLRIFSLTPNYRECRKRFGNIIVTDPLEILWGLGLSVYLGSRELRLLKAFLVRFDRLFPDS